MEVTEKHAKARATSAIATEADIACNCSHGAPAANAVPVRAGMSHELEEGFYYAKSNGKKEPLRVPADFSAWTHFTSA